MPIAQFVCIGVSFQPAPWEYISLFELSAILSHHTGDQNPTFGSRGLNFQVGV